MKQGMRGARPSTFATGQMYRQGNRWLLAVSYSMGTPACCMMLFGVRLMGSNVLKYTRDTSLCFAEYSGPWQPLVQRVQLKKSCGRAYHTSPFPVNQSHLQHQIQQQDSDCWGKAPTGRQPPAQTYYITYDVIYDIIIA